MVETVSRRESVSWVYRVDGKLFKEQPKTLTDNEMYALDALAHTGYVPMAKRVNIEVIELEEIEKESVTDISAFLAHYPRVISALEEARIRHGDLSVYSVRVKDNRPILIDWAESRYWTDPRPDKRREGDSFWLAMTMAKLCPWEWHNGRCNDIWVHICDSVPMMGKSVIDVGCGYGDFLIKSVMTGARIAVGVEHDDAIVSRLIQRKMFLPVLVANQDLVEHLEQCLQHNIKYDIGLCLSVLPYVDMARTLSLMRKVCDTVAIECQYNGDGPGVVEDDAEMYTHLRTYWDYVGKAGKTTVKEGRFDRTIWICQT